MPSSNDFTALCAIQAMFLAYLLLVAIVRSTLKERIPPCVPPPQKPLP